MLDANLRALALSDDVSQGTVIKRKIFPNHIGSWKDPPRQRLMVGADERKNAARTHEYGNVLQGRGNAYLASAFENFSGPVVDP